TTRMQMATKKSSTTFVSNPAGTPTYATYRTPTHHLTKRTKHPACEWRGVFHVVLMLELLATHYLLNVGYPLFYRRELLVVVILLRLLPTMLLFGILPAPTPAAVVVLVAGFFLVVMLWLGVIKLCWLVAPVAIESLAPRRHGATAAVAAIMLLV